MKTLPLVKEQEMKKKKSAGFKESKTSGIKKIMKNQMRLRHVEFCWPEWTVRSQTLAAWGGCITIK